MTFLTDVRLPIDVERGAAGGPTFRTSVTEFASGHEKRNIDWSEAKGEWDVSYGILRKDNPNSETDLNQVVTIFRIAQGRANSFRFKDWTDFEVGRENGVVTTPQQIGLGDDTTTAFQLFKSYGLSGFTYNREVTKIVSGTLQIYVEGVEQSDPADYSVDLNTGMVTFTSAPASTGGTGAGGAEIITASFEFDAHVRFDTDNLRISVGATGSIGSIPSIPIVELLGA